MNRMMKLVLPVVALFAAAACTQEKPPEQKVPAPAHIKSFTSSAAEVAQVGDTVTLSWEVESAQKVALKTLDGTALELADDTKAKGSVDVKVEADTVYVLTARGEGGSDTAAVAVAAPKEAPAPLFAAVPEKVTAGQSTTLVWNVPGASAVTLTDDGGNEVFTGEAQGSWDVQPLFTTTYTLKAGALTAQATVTVAVQLLGFASSPSAVHPGEPIVLSWQTGGAQKVTLSAEGRGVLHETTTASEMADGTYEDTAPALPSNGLVHYTLRAEQGDQVLTSELTVWVGVDPVIASFTAPEFAKVGGTFTVAWRTALADRVTLYVNGAAVHEAVSQAEVAEGSMTLASPSAEAQVELRATSSRGGAATATHAVAPVDVPVVSAFSVSPQVVAQGGDPATVTWNVPNARHVRIREVNGRLLKELSGVTAESGTLTVYPNRATDYLVEADNTVGDSITPATASVTEVTVPAKLVFDREIIPISADVQWVGTTVANGGAVKLAGLNQAVEKNPGDEAFIDISQTGAALPFTDGDDTTSYLITLPQPMFPRWFGTATGGSKVNVSINGWLSFSNSTVSGPSVPPTTLPDTDVPGNMVAAWLDDLQAFPDTQVLWRVDGDSGEQRLIVQWNNDHVYYSSTKTMTFQAQIYESGKIVLAYGASANLTSSDKAAYGVQNATQTAALTVPASDLPNGVHPAAGDVFRIFGYGDASLPYAFKASASNLMVRQAMPDGEIEIKDAPVILPASAVVISEVMYNPTLAGGQWLEVTNRSQTAYDLNGWVVKFGTSPFMINQPLLLAPGARAVLGQTTGAAEVGTPGGAAVDVVYGMSYVMPTASGSLTVEVAGVPYSTVAWTSAGTAGSSVRVQSSSQFIYASSTQAGLTCPSTMAFGVNGQKGTPGAPDTACLPYTKEPTAPFGFHSISATGTLIPGLSGAADEVYVSVALPRPVSFGDLPVSNLWVSSNGWLSVLSVTSASLSNPSTPSTSAPNGLVAPFWDDLTGNTGGGVYWQQFDPDGTPSTGDEYTLVSWENWKRASYVSTLNFQVKFVEGTKDIELHYGSMTSSYGYAQGSSATTWLESLDGSAALPININSSTEPGIQPDTGWRFKFVP